MGVKFGMEEGTFGATCNDHRCNVSPLRGEKPQNRPVSKLNTGRFALRAMLSVITSNNNNMCITHCLLFLFQKLMRFPHPIRLFSLTFTHGLQITNFTLVEQKVITNSTAKQCHVTGADPGF